MLMSLIYEHQQWIMAPSIETVPESKAEADDFPTEGYPQMMAPSKNVTFAVNYELAMVDQFLSADKRTRALRSIVETPTGATTTTTTTTTTDSTLETAATAIATATTATVVALLPSQVTSTDTSGLRRASDLENDAPNLLIRVQDSRNNNNNATGTNSDHDDVDADAHSHSVQQDEQEQHEQYQELPQQPQQQQEIKLALSLAGEKADADEAMLSSPPFSGRRVSTRDKQKREAPLARTRVRYDMQLVPPVRTNKIFLTSFEAWWVKDEADEKAIHKIKRRSSRFSTGITTTDEELHRCKCEFDNECHSTVFPFAEDSSVLWIPAKRSEWEDTVSEMTAVCTSAAIRRLQFLQQKRQAHSEPQQKKKHFQPPLSRDYIRDRIDIDDPLRGYQIRHKEGGWLQGFILYTHFTTWTCGFHWDSKHELCGVPKPSSETVASTNVYGTSINSNRYVDMEGSLAAELEAMPRAGDPSAGGIVFSGIAEISLLGGLGCGEYLLRMALDDIRAQQQYKYVALQATEQSRTFYERFGFVRVGAICQYGKPEPQKYPQQEAEQQESSVMGYRHWTHANESERSLQMHGGPSYMMCLKLPARDATELESTIDECAQCGRPSKKTPSFVDHMLALRVDSKPRVEQLGASTTPGPKFAVRRSNSVPIEVSASFDGSGNSSPRGGNGKKNKLAKNPPDVKLPRRKSNTTSPVPLSSANTTIATSVRIAKAMSTSSTSSALPAVATNHRVKVAYLTKRSLSTNALLEADEPKRKRQKVEAKARSKPALTSGVALPPEGRPLSYVEKQYHSVWLAVPPAEGTATTPRPPPKARVALSDDALKSNSTKKSAVSTTPVTNSEVVTSLASPKPTDAAAPSNVDAYPRRTPRQPSPAKSAVKSLPSRRKDRSKSQSTTVSKTESGRVYHSVRGPDGKFLRVYIDNPNQPIPHAHSLPKKTPPTARPTSRSKKRATPSSDKKSPAPKQRASFEPDDDDGNFEQPSLIATRKPGKPTPIDKKTFRKQKVRSYPRDRVHYFNRVVKPKRRNSSNNKLFFVVEYDEVEDLLCLVPMFACGTLLGKREGRPRYQCAIGDTDENFKIVAAADYEVVRSAMVMKTPILAAEAWDIETSDDEDFVTR